MPRSDQGVYNDRYQVIPRCLIFITREDSVLLIKGNPHKRLWANLFNGIGGHIEFGEDILTAAQRELREETGLTVDDMWLCGNVMVDASEKTGISIFIFRGTYQGGDLISSEEGELEWVSQASLADLPMVEDLYALLPRIISLQKGQPPLIAHTSYDSNDQMVLKIR